MKRPTFTTPEERVVEVYRQKKTTIQNWLEAVQLVLQQWMAHEPEKRVHSIRARMKDEHHLFEKIRDRNSKRKAANDPKKPQIDETNLFSQVIDLAGVRVLALYRQDLALLDHFINQSDKWRVLSAEAYVSDRRTDIDWFKSLGFNEDEEFRSLKIKQNGYSSIHYVLVSPTPSSPDEDNSRPEKCELQIRTIHEEAWGEFSHQYSYPKEWADPLAQKLIVRLSSLLHLAEDLVGDIRNSPADAKIFREIYATVRRTKTTTDRRVAVTTITQLISKFPYMTQSAPLAAIGLLTRTADDSVGTIRADRIVTTGFWTESFPAAKASQLDQIYLDAQYFWAKETGGKVLKFYFQNGDSAGPLPRKLPESVPRKLAYFLVPHAVSEYFHTSFEQRGITHGLGLSLRNVQMFIWPSTLKLPSPVKLPGNRRELYGFYSPIRDSDLLSGAVWCADPDHKMFALLRAYGNFLGKLSTNGKICIALPVAAKVQLPNSLKKPEMAFIDAAIDKYF